jgi:hypothetical protein
MMTLDLLDRWVRPSQVVGKKALARWSKGASGGIARGTRST